MYDADEVNGTALRLRTVRPTGCGVSHPILIIYIFVNAQKCSMYLYLVLSLQHTCFKPDAMYIIIAATSYYIGDSGE